MKNFAFIFARGGSKGLPNKNILEIADKPLIGHSILIAKKIKSIEKVFVSTEDEKIALIASKYGAHIIPRPESLASDDAPEWNAWQHAINFVMSNFGNFENFISLPATSPLRSENDIKKCINQMDENTDIVITVSKAKRNPWFNMVEVDDRNFATKLKGDQNFFRRQDCPEIYDVTTVAYVARPEFILNSTQIWDGRVSAVEIPPERAIDIDTKLDFDIAKYLMSKL